MGAHLALSCHGEFYFSCTTMNHALLSVEKDVCYLCFHSAKDLAWSDCQSRFLVASLGRIEFSEIKTWIISVDKRIGQLINSSEDTQMNFFHVHPLYWLYLGPWKIYLAVDCVRGVGSIFRSILLIVFENCWHENFKLSFPNEIFQHPGNIKA